MILLKFPVFNKGDTMTTKGIDDFSKLHYITVFVKDIN